MPSMSLILGINLGSMPAIDLAEEDHDEDNYKHANGRRRLVMGPRHVDRIKKTQHLLVAEFFCETAELRFSERPPPRLRAVADQQEQPSGYDFQTQIHFQETNQKFQRKDQARSSASRSLHF